MGKILREGIGIIGGAGPMAGLLLNQKIIEICQKKYGCIRDADFPRQILLSVPFAEMLKPNTASQNDKKVYEQLKSAINFLLNSGISSYAIACNTLHGYLSDIDQSCLFNLIVETKKYVTKNHFSKVLVLSTSTSVQKNVYDLKCSRRLQVDQQVDIDDLITKILSGDTSEKLRNRLKAIVESNLEDDPSIDAVLLGCSELSLLLDKAPSNFLNICTIDPVEIVAVVMCANYFNDNRRN